MNGRTGGEPRRWLADTEAQGDDAQGDETQGDEGKRKRVFGRTRHPAWKEPLDDTERATLEAAKHQHEIARQIRSRIQDNGLSTAEAAKKAGMNLYTLHRILNGTTSPTLYQLHRIAGAVGVPFIGGYPRRGDQTLNDAG